MRRPRTTRGGVLAAAALLTMGATALGGAAAQTTAGQPVTNTFSLSYTSGGTTTNVPTAGSAVFTVDRKVDLEVVSTNNALVQTGSVNQALFFTVQNSGNDAFRYLLSAGSFSATSDDFDVNGLQISYSSPQTGSDCSSATYGAEGTVGAAVTTNEDVPVGSYICVRVTGDIPPNLADGNSPNDGNTSVVSLIAEARQPAAWVNQATNQPTTGTASPGGSVDTTVANTVAGVAQNVARDGANADTTGGGGDAAADSKASDSGTYTVQAASLTGTKQAFGIPDTVTCSAAVPSNADGSVYMIEGTCVLYEIAVTNGGAAAATNVSISDTLPAGLTFVSVAETGDFTGGSAPTTDDGTGSACTAATVGCTVSLTGKGLGAGDSGQLLIRALVL